MGSHLIAYFSTGVNGVIDTNLLPVEDQIVFSEPNRFRVPEIMNSTNWQLLQSSLAGLQDARIETPSIIALGGFYLNPQQAITPNAIGAITNVFNNSPMQLATNEQMELRIQGTFGAPTDIHCLLSLTDRDLQQVDGNIIRVRAQSAVQQVDGVWTNGRMFFDQPLPVGDYQVVGFIPQSADLIAARIVFTGSQWRPGNQNALAITQGANTDSQWGRAGVLGEFNTTAPPSIDVIGGVAAVQVYYFDLIKVG